MSGMTDNANLKVVALVLAGGESRRMGTPKMLLPFGNMTMIERVICNIKASGLTEVTVVLGAVRDQLVAKLEGCGVRWCINEKYSEGMLSSVICGLENTDSEAAAIIFPGDQPLIRPVTIKAVLEKFRSGNTGMAVAAYNGKRGHPLIIHPGYRGEIRSLDPSRGLRQLPEKHPEDVLQVEADDPGILKDFDTYDEYLNEIKIP